MNTALERLMQRLQTSGTEAILLHSPQNRRYITQTRTSAGVLAVTAAGEAVLAVDFRDYTAAKNALSGSQISVEQIEAGAEDVWSAEFLRRSGAARVYVEDGYLTWNRVEALRARCGLELCPGQAVMDELRQEKSPEELRKITASQRIAEQSLLETWEMVRPGISEQEVAAYLTWRLLTNGAENGEFGIVAASGPNSALPHATPGTRRLCRGDFLLIDFGAIFDGYYSDITRTVAVGEADEKMREVYAVVLAANEAAAAQLRAGAAGEEIDACARNVIAQAGYGAYFGHGLGHAVGLDIHETPRLWPGSKDVLAAGNVVTVEPGIYLPGQFGVRIEDLLQILPDGRENLTALPRKLQIL